MSWFSQYVEHPFVAAIARLTASPVVQSNPGVAQAVADVKAQATAVASTTTAAAGSIVAAAQAAADPSVNALGAGLQAAVDAYLTAALGPVGVALEPAANAVIALGEDKAHSLIAALFAHAKSQVPVTGAQTLQS